MTKLLTIITPTYNRCEYLSKLFLSLKRQTNKNFIWLIIDDGSKDETEEIVKSFYSESFDIIYKKKINGGKHTAINYAHQFINTELLMIVDSDDILEDNAVNNIEFYWNKYQNKNLAGIFFLKANFQGEISGFKFKTECFIENYNGYILSNPKRSENADVWVTKIFKQYPFPEFKDEYYVAETTVFTQISRDYDSLFVNKIIYRYEYLEDGLTKKARMLRIKNPLGSMENAIEILKSNISLFLNIKNVILYLTYGRFAKLTYKTLLEKAPKNINKSLIIFMLPISWIIKTKWEYLYRKGIKK